MDAIEACNEQLEIRCNELEISQQDQLIQLTKSIDEIKQLIINNHHLFFFMPHRLFFSISPAISLSISLITYNNNSLVANLRFRWS